MKRRTTAQVIMDSIKEGYVVLREGTGSYDEAVAEERAKGYDVRYWYVKNEDGTKGYIIYGKKLAKKSRGKKSEPVVTMVYYDQMTLKELKEIAKKKSISGYYKMKKNELVDALYARV